MKSIVTIGGGTGSFTLLTGLKKYPVSLKAIVAMSDDGGSTGVLRDELGVLPPGDIRQCLVALSEAEGSVRDLFNYRFEEGGMRGHSFGNIFLSALEKTTGSFEEAVRVAGMVLSVRGAVIPVTTGSVSLVAGHGEATQRGEHIIDAGRLVERGTLRLEPEAQANPKAIEAIETADCLVIGPGDLYTSIIPNLLVKGIAEAVRRSRATVVYNCNLVNKAGHTDGFQVDDYVKEIERFVGTGRVDFVTCNNRWPEEMEILERYGEEGKSLLTPFDSGRAAEACAYRLLAADLLSTRQVCQKDGDVVKRTLIRHDADALAALIIHHCLGGI
jgi:uncharacterized cofD-like protein